MCTSRQKRRAPPLRISSSMLESLVDVGHAVVRIELSALTLTGPYRLTVEHPAKRLVEYFDRPVDALARRAEIESVLLRTAVPVPTC
jgi:hypothetical protein